LPRVDGSGKLQQAEPHIGHPVEELYGDVEGKPHNGMCLSLNPRYMNSTGCQNQHQTSQRLQHSMPLYKLLIRRSQPYLKVSFGLQFVLGVMNGMLKTAAEEYKAAIADNKFVELVSIRIPEDSSSMLKISTKIY